MPLTPFEVELRNLLLQHSKTAKDAAESLRRIVAAHSGLGPVEPPPAPVVAADDPQDPPEGPGN